MFIKLFFTVILVTSAISRHVARYEDLDEEDQLLFRAAYDTPSYSQEEYHEDEELIPVGKLDLLKDGMWAVKAKIKEMKIFNKALAANLLATKLQVKLMLANQLKTLKKHHHFEIVKKPVYNYQGPPHPPAYNQYEQPHYTAPVYEPQHYTAPGPHYDPPQYNAPVPQYEPPQYNAPAPQYEAHQQGAPQYSHDTHDPYYGH